jgi:flap endonuclease-1
MGIKNLSKLIKKHCATGLRDVGMTDLRGMRVAIDVSIFMYKFVYKTNGDPIPCFLRMVDTCDRFSITPIFVFDGACSPQKAAEMEKRREERERNRKQLEELDQALLSFQGSSTERREMEVRRVKVRKRVHSVPTRRHYNSLREVLGRHSLRIVESEMGDAEKQCVALMAQQQCDAVVSEDFDSLTYMAGIGGARGTLVTGFATPQMRAYDLQKILEELGLSAPSFIDLCILAGCDFTSCKIKGIAIFRGYALVKKHATIETVLEHLEPRFEVPECFEYQKAREEFTLLGRDGPAES